MNPMHFYLFTLMDLHVLFHKTVHQFYYPMSDGIEINPTLSCFSCDSLLNFVFEGGFGSEKSIYTNHIVFSVTTTVPFSIDLSIDLHLVSLIPNR